MCVHRGHLECTGGGLGNGHIKRSGDLVVMEGYQKTVIILVLFYLLF